MSERFDVVVWKDGFWEYFLRDLDAGRAVKAAKFCTERWIGPSLDKVQIIDGDDFTVFHWEAGKGVIYPPGPQA